MIIKDDDEIRGSTFEKSFFFTVKIDLMAINIRIRISHLYESESICLKNVISRYVTTAILAERTGALYLNTGILDFIKKFCTSNAPAMVNKRIITLSARKL
jgi:hypothetical protein